MKDERVKSVIRALQIIEALSYGEKSLVEVARALDLHVATARRLLMTLLGTNFVQQNKETKKYCLGLKLLLIAKKAVNSLDLRQQSLPYLRELMEKSDETANLVIEDKDQAVYIEQVECNNSLRIANVVGSRAPLYCTAAGKILLSSRSKEEREKYLQKIKLIPHTENTIISKKKLLSELDLAAETNIALDIEEQMIGERCLAAPIRNQNGEIVAAVSISGPSVRLSVEKIKELEPIILKVSLNLSEQLGFEESTSQQE